MKKDNYTSAIVISVILHLVLVAALIWGTDFSLSEPKPMGSMVQAVVIDPQLVQQQAQEIRQQREAASRAEQERLEKLRKQSEQLEQNRRTAEEQVRKLKEEKARAEKAAREAEKQQQLEQERVRKEQEKLRREKELAVKAEAERKKKQADLERIEQERQAKQAAIEKAEQERLAREKAAQEAKVAAEKAEQRRLAEEKAAKEAQEKARKEKQRLEQLERERKEQEAALGDIFAGLETESAQNSVAKQKHIASETDRYGAIYTQLITQNLLVEDSFRGKSCKVSLRLLPTGSGAILRDVTVKEGDSSLCAATKRAVAQVSSFPLPSDPDVVAEVKDIILTVIPEL